MGRLDLRRGERAFFLKPGEELVGGRILDTLIGVGAVLVVSFFFWPVNRLAEIRSLDGQLRATTRERLVAIRQWLKTSQAEPVAAPVAITGSRLAQQLSQLVNDELRSTPLGPGQRQRWRQWLHHPGHHQCERLAAGGRPGAGPGAARRLHD